MSIGQAVGYDIERGTDIHEVSDIENGRGRRDNLPVIRNTADLQSIDDRPI
jgi:hypothetical protein